MDTTLAPAAASLQRVREVLSLFKLRIGGFISITALVGFAVSGKGQDLTLIQVTVLALSVLLASASAGAFNQYAEAEGDRLMARTRKRPFATGAIPRRPAWLLLMALMLALAVGSAAWVLNAMVAFYIFLGAFFYGVVYTLWLKRRSWLNIVVGGLSGSFAALAGAAAVDPGVGVHGWLLALALFLWTPPHFWSLAIAGAADYTAAGVPMLPVVVGNARAARIVYASAVALGLAALLPMFFGAGWIYLLGALGGGGYFVLKARALALAPSRATAMASFFASLLQLGALLAAASIDGLLR
ncbi:heme o synthase [Roseateles oligotrophus]|uniref:Protoheme IX farnesyltransferase n=1 Tax=Roseateles oligotrophus TaxID=1769250 RepID=A0ABT2Y9S9_9BURK|nr:heme o synthase [Roseateles oligotrophus]MCV2367051.1 heme o synthase [Roseateles oligotrophus]